MKVKLLKAATTEELEGLVNTWVTENNRKYKPENIRVGAIPDGFLAVIIYRG